MSRIGAFADMTAQQQLKAFEDSQARYVSAQGQLSEAVKQGDEVGIFEAKQAMEKETRIMTTLANISEAIHKLFMRLIDKLNIRV